MTYERASISDTISPTASTTAHGDSRRPDEAQQIRSLGQENHIEITILTVTATLACASAPFALQAASAEQNKRVEQLDQLAFPVGDWTCSGSIAAMDKKPGHATTGHARVPQGFSRATGSRSATTKSRPRRIPSRITSLNTSATTRPRSTTPRSRSIAAAQSAYAVGASTGWNGNALAVDATVSMDGKDVAYRDVFTKKGAERVQPCRHAQGQIRQVGQDGRRDLPQGRAGSGPEIRFPPEKSHEANLAIGSSGPLRVGRDRLKLLAAAGRSAQA